MSRFDGYAGRAVTSATMFLHGTEVVYHPFGKPSRTVRMVLHYQLPDEEHGAPFVLAELSDDPDIGIPAHDLDRGRDSVALPFPTKTSPTIRRSIANISEPVGGAYTMELR